MYWIGKSRCIIYKKITITHKKTLKEQTEKTTSCSPIQTASNIFFFVTRKDLCTKQAMNIKYTLIQM